MYIYLHHTFLTRCEDHFFGKWSDTQVRVLDPSHVTSTNRTFFLQFGYWMHYLWCSLLFVIAEAPRSWGQLQLYSVPWCHPQDAPSMPTSPRLLQSGFWPFGDNVKLQRFPWQLDHIQPAADRFLDQEDGQTDEVKFRLRFLMFQTPRRTRKLKNAR